MQKLFPIIIILVAALIGGGGGYFLKLQAAQGAHDPDAQADGEESSAADHGDSDETAADDGHEKKAAKKKPGHGGGHGEASKSGSTFMRFGRQFVVPVIKQGKPKSMVILDINIEIDSSMEEIVYTFEPRLRDALLARLLQLAGEGMLPQMLEDNDKMEQTKLALLETSRSIIGDGALSVLILDIGMQSY